MNKNKKTESGRSMVEILGVLAIIGVLSIGGITGYTYSMNQYYTNELLVGASERAVLVSAQILTGISPSLEEFNNITPGGTFDEIEEFIDGGFGLKVSGVKTAVCQNVIKATADTSIFIAKDDNASILNEMNISDCSEENNSFWFVYDDLGGGDTSDENICDTCLENQKCLTVSGEKKCISLCPEGQTMNEETGSCSNNKCSDNSNCDTQKQFCLLTNASEGTCSNIGSVHITSYNDKQYIYNDVNMNWYSAQNWCRANGKEMISLSELGCPQISGSNDCDGYYKSNFSSKFGGHYRWAKESFWIFAFHTDYGLVRFCEGCSHRAACEY